MKALQSLKRLRTLLFLPITLQALVDLRRISMALMKRIKANYNGIVGFNGALVGGGVLGIMPPSQTA